MPSAAMSSPSRRSSPMTRRCRCWCPAQERHKRRGSGPMPGTNAPGPGRRRRPPGIASPATARASTRRITSPASAAGCMPMAMPRSRISTAPAQPMAPTTPVAVTLPSRRVGRDCHHPHVPQRPSLERGLLRDQGEKRDPACFQSLWMRLLETLGRLPCSTLDRGMSRAMKQSDRLICRRFDAPPPKPSASGLPYETLATRPPGSTSASSS